METVPVIWARPDLLEVEAGMREWGFRRRKAAVRPGVAGAGQEAGQTQERAGGVRVLGAAENEEK